MLAWTASTNLYCLNTGDESCVELPPWGCQRWETCRRHMLIWQATSRGRWHTWGHLKRCLCVFVTLTTKRFELVNSADMTSPYHVFLTSINQHFPGYLLPATHLPECVCGSKLQYASFRETWIFKFGLVSYFFIAGGWQGAHRLKPWWRTKTLLLLSLLTHDI